MPAYSAAKNLVLSVSLNCNPIVSNGASDSRLIRGDHDDALSVRSHTPSLPDRFFLVQRTQDALTDRVVHERCIRCAQRQRRGRHVARSMNEFLGQLAPTSHSSPCSTRCTSSFLLTAVEDCQWETRVSEARKPLLYLSMTVPPYALPPSTPISCPRRRCIAGMGEAWCRGLYLIHWWRQMQLLTSHEVDASRVPVRGGLSALQVRRVCSV